LVNCGNNPVDSGYVSMLLDGLNYRAVVSNGAFTLPIHRCFLSTDPVQLLAVDQSTGQQSAVKTVLADTATVNVGQLTACSAVDTGQNIKFTVGGNSYNYAAPQATILDVFYPFTNMTYLVATSGNSTISLGITGLSGPGTYTDSILFNVGSTDYIGPITYNVTAYGPVNSYIQGTFTGAVVTENSPPVPSTLTGSFYIQRTQ
jgi:hypothetical protein